jgi:hypothetical protein
MHDAVAERSATHTCPESTAMCAETTPASDAENV